MTLPGRRVRRVGRAARSRARVLPGALLVVSVFVVSVLGSSALAAAPAAACGCAAPSRVVLADAEVVFSGTVRRETGLSDRRAFTVAVDRVFRGEVHRRQDVVTPDRSSACGLAWRVGDRVIAAGAPLGDAVSAELCGGSMSARLDGAGYDRALSTLGQGEAPLAGAGRAERAGLTYDQWRTGRLVLGVLGLCVMALVAFRALRGRLARRRASDGG